MATLLEKLDRKAKAWLDEMDSQLQKPIERTLTGKVFTEVSSHNGHGRTEHTSQPVAHQQAAAAVRPAHEPNANDCDIVCPSILGNASA